MCKKKATTEIFLSNNNKAQFDQKKKGLRDLGPRDYNVDDLYDMLAVIIDVTNATKRPDVVDKISQFVTEVEADKRDRPAGTYLVYSGASPKQVEQLYGALKNVFGKTGNKRELSSRIRNVGGLLRTMIEAEQKAIKDYENEQALQMLNKNFGKIDDNVNKNSEQLGVANAGLTNIASTQQKNAETINAILKYVEKESIVWNAQSNTMLKSMDSMDKSLLNVDKYLDPSQYKNSYNIAK